MNYEGKKKHSLQTGLAILFIQIYTIKLPICLK